MTSYVVVEGWADLRVRWDGHDGVYVEMGDKYKGITCGLCGNHNGNKDDDFMTNNNLVRRPTICL